jgi:hypothetical protein
LPPPIRLPLTTKKSEEIYMYKKKLICLAMASLLPMGGQVMAQEEAAASVEAVAEQPAEAAEAATAPAAAPAESATPAAEAAAAETAVAPADPDPAEAPAATPSGYSATNMEERWQAREERYEALKQRAAEAGVMLPDEPPWKNREAMRDLRPSMEERMEHRKKMQSMTPEEREAFRMERYQEMRERATEMGMELPETPPWKARQEAMDAEWAKHQEVIKGMSDEERAACHAMHRRHMMQDGPGGMGPGAMGPGGMGRGYGPGPGYGYGPGPWGPRGNFWDPAQ